jgi:uncharacterized membrane protein YidH (DUF202 family)
VPEPPVAPPAGAPAGAPAPDAGAAWERTRLAWRRTVLSAAGVALLAARLGLVLMPDESAGVVLGAVALTGWTAFAYLASRRMRALAAHAAATERRPVITAALGTVGYAAVGVGIVLVALA